ncbi:hypothetical protein ACJQWK_05262 [Exserohilum turcicum]|uniref:Kynurenine formamidase n=1 Tax=Exserohilum turcicum (strain 28A) TaxID=671987 RepID=R0I8X7_EXST2|nr:uncharacterized protein SETTUDRAFT_97466 [Exserohilum turcica Et28A]EOA81851.1 hypothetical protein SETTUDRAFT_97466 [Exserohilum turcica Et28A]
MTSDVPGFPQYLAAVPYTQPAGYLRTVDLWLRSSDNSNADSSGLWVIYLHGGAWRDPAQNSQCFLPTLSTLSTSPSHAPTLQRLAGIASINYRLSPHPTHATDPSTPDDAERSVHHPQHVRDVRDALAYLQREHGAKRWIGVGHSCGATLLLQLVSAMGLEQSLQQTGIVGPEALILLEGIYNIPLLLKNHAAPACPPHFVDMYKALVAGAFGPHNEQLYLAVSPVSGHYGVQEWPESKLLVMCHSYEDDLVERAQRDVMCVALDREGWSIVMEAGDEEDEVRREGRRVLNVRDLRGTHDFIWRDGNQMATLITEVVQRLA